MSIGKVLRKEQREIRLIDKIINDGFLTEEQRIANAKDTVQDTVQDNKGIDWAEFDKQDQIIMSSND